MRGLNGKRVIVAGGATGIGASTAERLASEGALVAVGDIDLEQADWTAARITAAGGRAIAVEFDLADDASVVDLVESAVSEFGGVDGLYNVGADLSPQTLLRDLTVLDTDVDVWRRTFEVDVLGYVRTCKAVLPHMVEAGSGSIVNTSSGAAFIGLPNRVAYSVAKAGVNALTRHIASVWGKQGIRCNTVEPGMVLSDHVKNMGHHELHAEILKGIRNTRLGDPSDLAAAVTFLLSDDAEWVNGQAWNVDGGQNLRG